MTKILSVCGIAHVKRGEQKFTTFPDILLQAGEAFGIMGKSGSGKGMLIKIAAGLIKPTHGEVKIYTDQVSYVFLDSGLLHNYSVADNLRIALLFSNDTENIEVRIRASLERFGLLNIQDAIIDSLPEIPKRLVQYARADVLQPKLLFIEEPLKHIRMEDHNLIKMWLKDYVNVEQGACMFTSMFDNYWSFLTSLSLNLSSDEVSTVTIVD